MHRRSLRSGVVAALFAALTGVAAQVRFFLPGATGVPVTLQSLMVLLAGGVLGPVQGCTAMVLYLFLGAAGLPVFSGGTGGIGVILGPGGGYLLSFPAAAWLVGVLTPVRRSPSLVATSLAMLVGLAAIYAGGAGWAYLVGGQGLSAAVSGWVLPFLPLDLVKAAAAAALSAAVRRRLAVQGYWAETSRGG